MTNLEFYLAAQSVILLLFLIIDGQEKRKVIRRLQDHIAEQDEHIKDLKENYSKLIAGYKKLVEKL